jgi:vitamin B12 transporter
MRLREISNSVFFGASAALLAVPAFAQTQSSDLPERVVVSASLLGAVPGDLLTSSVSVLTPLDLELRQTQIVSDVLRDVPGVAVNRGGAVGAFTQVRIRGAEANHTLVLIDGIKASDPFFGEFDFATLIADDVAKVEVLRGEQSALYGSDAIGGVIQYITATGAEAPGLRVRAEGGSFGTFGSTARFAGVSGKFDYAISGAYQRSDGTPDSRFGTRNLGSDNGAISGKFIYAIAENFRIKATARYSATNADVNSQDFNFPAGPTYGFELDDNGSYKNTALYGLLSAEFEGLDDHWRNAVTIQGVDAERNGYGNNFSPADLRTSGDKGRREKATYVTSYDFGTPMLTHKFTGAVDWEREYYQNTDPTGFADTTRRHTDNIGYVGQYDLVFDHRLAVNASGRFDQNYRFEDDFTYHFGASYLFDTGTRLHAATGTGTKAPTIYQLYGFTPGPGGFTSNPNLKPEKSQGWEAGAEQSFLGGMAVASATYFHSTLKDEIDTVFLPPNFDAMPVNLATQSTREGVESGLTFRFGWQWRIDGTYTYLRARENGQPEIRRPENIASLNVSWRAETDRYGANLTVRYNGDQKDFQFTPIGSTPVNMPSYTLVNLGADYRISDMWQFYGRVENLFDSKYEEQFSFRSPGRAFYAGVRATFQ